jgi:hypothetical protein
MALLEDVKGILSQYTAGASPSGDPGAHFQEVARSVETDTLTQGIAAAMRSDQTPPFAQIVSQLFASGSSDQQSAMVNTLLSSITPEQRATISAAIPGLGGDPAGAGGRPAATTPASIRKLAQQAEKQDVGIIDKMSALYAAHPTLVRTLGSTAMMIAMRKIAERHQNA